MTDRTEALDALIAAVEAGGWPDRRTEVAAFYTGGSIAACNEHAGLAREANAGSLDAALRLHEALLPGWHWTADDGQGQEGPFWHVFKFDGTPEEIGEGEAATPARAWLIAILRAYRAKEGG